MAKVASNLKLAWLKGVEAVGTSASNLASSARVKVQEMNLEARKREIFTELGMAALALWQKEQSLPEPLDAMLKELSEVNESLSALRAKKQTPANAEKEEEQAPEGAAAEAPEAVVIAEAVAPKAEEVPEAVDISEEACRAEAADGLGED